MNKFTIGIDYGTNSVRAVVVDISNGKEAGVSIFNYPSGEQGILLDKKNHNCARQDPADYVKGLEVSVTKAIAAAKKFKGFCPENIIAVGVDTTGSTPIPVDERNVPLAFKPEFKKNLNAMAWLWKDHTGADEALLITETARRSRPQYLAKCGGIYSSEWFWSKILHCLKVDPKVFDAAYTWVEHCDWMTAQLSGVKDPLKVKRGVCAAGHKAMYSDDWGGYPDKNFLAELDPRLADLRGRLSDKAYAGDEIAGKLCDEWAKKLGLTAGIPVAIGAFDAHNGAVGAGVDSNTMVKIIGTSTCDITVHPVGAKLADIPGICGIVNGSVLPGNYGLEAGQSAVGDIFKWFVEVVCKGKDSLHAELTAGAAKLKPGESGLIALDWNNGNRTILVDQKLTGLIMGQTLHTSQAEIYRALIEATAFGARMIIDRFKEYGVKTGRIICCGGIAEKNPMLMQIYADVTGCVMQVSGSSQTCALGSAIYAAVAAGRKAGGYDSFEQAQKKMTSVKKIQYKPDPAAQKVYERLFRIYRKLHDSFGNVSQSNDLGKAMKELIAIKEEQTK